MSAFPIVPAVQFITGDKSIKLDPFEHSTIYNRKIDRATRKGCIISILKHFDRYEEFKKHYWPIPAPQELEKLGFYSRHWNNYKSQNSAIQPVNTEDDEYIEENEDESENLIATDIVDVDPAQEIREFSLHLESHLRDAIAKDLSLIEQGLTLYKDPENGKTGVEFVVGAGRIDILAVDTNDKLVVIELKRFRGRNRALGQILYYMGWIEKNMKNGKDCRGIIIANDIDQELQLAATCVKNVLLCNYSIKFELKRLNN